MGLILCAVFPFIANIHVVEMVWTILFLSMVIKQVHSAIAFTDIIVLVNNSTTTENLGVVNGLGQSFASLARAIGPLIAGYLWSLAEATSFPPIPYLFIVGLGVLTLLVSFSLRRELDTISSSK